MWAVSRRHHWPAASPARSYRSSARPTSPPSSGSSSTAQATRSPTPYFPSQLRDESTRRKVVTGRLAFICYYPPRSQQGLLATAVGASSCGRFIGPSAHEQHLAVNRG